MKKTKKIKYFLIIFLIVLISTFSLLYFLIRNKIYEQKNNNLSYKEEMKKISYEKNNNQIKKDKIINILLIGLDRRQTKDIARADSIIIATIDRESNKIKFSSILRDTNVDIKNYGEGKINSAYAYGGAELLIDTIYRNLSFELNSYITIDFLGFEKLIDDIGGLEINIKPYEIKEMNKYIGEVDEKKSPFIKKAGNQSLDGQQVLAYTRIRKVGNGVFERTERQRAVMALITEKIKNMGILNSKILVKNLLNNIKTNIEPINLMKYGVYVANMEDLKFEQVQIPSEEFSKGKIYKGSWRILMDKEKNSKLLNDFIYNKK